MSRDAKVKLDTDHDVPALWFEPDGFTWDRKHNPRRACVALTPKLIAKIRQLLDEAEAVNG